MVGSLTQPTFTDTVRPEPTYWFGAVIKED